MDKSGGGKSSYLGTGSIQRPGARRTNNRSDGNNTEATADGAAEETRSSGGSASAAAAASATSDGSLGDVSYAAAANGPQQSSVPGNAAAPADARRDDGDSDSDYDSENRPGAYHVPGLAFGEYPAWGHARSSSGAAAVGTQEDGGAASVDAASDASPPESAAPGAPSGSPPRVEIELAHRTTQQSIAAFLVDEEDGRRTTTARQGSGGSSSLLDESSSVSASAAEESERAAAVVAAVATAAAAAASEDNSTRRIAPTEGNDSQRVPVVEGVPCSTEDDKAKSRKPARMRRTLLLLSAIALAGIVIGLSISFSGRKGASDQGADVLYPNEDDPDEEEESAPPNGESDEEEADVVEPDEQQPKMWKMIGSPIHGLRNQSGTVIHIDPTTGGPSLSRGKASNFTFSGYALALSDDGYILAVGEAGTDSVRVFHWDGDSQDWTPRGRTLISRRYETECLDAETGEFLGGGNFFDCHVSFGFNIALSGDGSMLIANSPGVAEGGGILSTFLWDTAGSDWVELTDSEIQGDGPGDGLGSAIKLTPDGRTMAVVGPQSFHDEFAALFGEEGFAGRGYAKVFDLVDGSTWVQRGDTIHGRNEGDGVGFVDIAENGQSIAIGTFFGGYADIYDWEEASKSWVLRGNSLQSPIGEIDFGAPILFSSPDGSRVVVGSTYAGDDVTTKDANLIYVYEWDGSSWVELDRMVMLVSSSGYAGRFGSVDVSFDGSRLVAVFAKGTQMYEWNGNRYVQKGEYVEGGRSLALSRNGEVFAVGRPFDNSLGLGMGRTTTYTGADMSEDTVTHAH